MQTDGGSEPSPIIHKIQLSLRRGGRLAPLSLLISFGADGGRGRGAGSIEGYIFHGRN